MALALFDLDETLLDGDSDYLWGRFLVTQGRVDADHYEQENQRFYDDYKQGQLDIHTYLRFQLQYLSNESMETLATWHQTFLSDMIRPIILPKGRDLLEMHHRKGDVVVIITATNRFVTGPIARELGVAHLLATELEIRNHRYTGRPQGEPCFQAGKVRWLERWLATTGHTLEGSHFYSDSINDLPLFGRVTHPVAVDPDPRLRAHAQQHGWRILSLR
jgi:HAD superfamily hydrolase (TIGR01490 family)